MEIFEIHGNLTHYCMVSFLLSSVCVALYLVNLKGFHEYIENICSVKT